MNRMLRAAVTAAVTVLVAGALGGCAFLTPPKKFSDTTTVTAVSYTHLTLPTKA